MGWLRDKLDTFLTAMGLPEDRPTPAEREAAIPEDKKFVTPMSSGSFMHGSNVTESITNAIRTAYENNRPVDLGDFNGVEGMIVDPHSSIDGVKATYSAARQAKTSEGPEAMKAVVEAAPEQTRLRAAKELATIAPDEYKTYVNQTRLNTVTIDTVLDRVKQANGTGEDTMATPDTTPAQQPVSTLSQEVSAAVKMVGAHIAEESLPSQKEQEQMSPDAKATAKDQVEDVAYRVKSAKEAIAAVNANAPAKEGRGR